MLLPEQMKYMDMEKPGGPEVFRVSSGPLPKPNADEVLIRVLAAGVNYPDVLQRMGVYPPQADASPIIGLEVAGEVISAGSDVRDLKPGEKVCALTNGGGYAEYCTAPGLQCLPWPQGYDAVQAAAIPETYFTVWVNIFQLGRLREGDSVLVHGGAGGIGITAIQLVHEFGCRIYVTEGSKEKCDACVLLGADAAINFRENDFADRIMELTAGKGVDVVLDIIGAPNTARNLSCLAMDGRLVQLSVMQGSKVEIDLMHVMSRRLIITGSMMRPRSTDEKGRIARDLYLTVWPVLDSGRCAPVIHQVFPLAEAAQAHRIIESGTHIGKIVLKVAD
ncbi:MAG TPA: NAD(P)H-quinone oxidoreductase [Desulfomonilia bacterium]|nr:NAD(P)H-quinone oxidoreductase [Desulfomonilia bacterium]